MGVSHCLPPQPISQWHSPGAVHSPRPWHAAGQAGCSHCSPSQPSKHSQPPFSAGQWPWPWHSRPRRELLLCPAPHRATRESAGRSTASEQSAPCQPSKQRHCPGALHTPWPVQSCGHAASEQSMEPQPGSQRHVPGEAHTPRPAPAEQLFAHAGWLQSAPPQPS